MHETKHHSKTHGSFYPLTTATMTPNRTCMHHDNTAHSAIKHDDDHLQHIRDAMMQIVMAKSIQVHPSRPFVL
jgi:hypothetical protein